MKLALLGDIHGNKFALQAVLESAKNHNVDKLLITGDLVGYYPFVKEVLDLLKPWKKFIVSGNHEVMMKNSINDNDYLKKISSKYGSSIKIALNTLSSKEIDYLTGLPHPLHIEIDNKKIILCHGSPENINEYLYPDINFELLQWADNYSAEIVVCGHTHHPMLKKVKNKIYVNPGSVGQPRNKSKKAHWVLYDTDTNIFIFKEETYDIKKMITIIKKDEPNIPYLYKILESNG